MAETMSQMELYKGSGKLIPPKRELIWLEEGRKCHWCGRATSMTSDTNDLSQATIDHVIPRGRGGTDQRDNLVSACLACNRRRNNEDMKGMREGALLARKDSPAKVVLTGDEKAALAARLPKPGNAEALRADRDRLLREVMKLRDEKIELHAAKIRNESRIAELTCKLEAMTVWMLIKRRLIAWLS